MHLKIKAAANYTRYLIYAFYTFSPAGGYCWLQKKLLSVAKNRKTRFNLSVSAKTSNFSILASLCFIGLNKNCN